MRSSSGKQQVDIFYTALCIKNDDKRKAFLERACAKDAAMLAHIEKLLAVRGDADRFFADCSIYPEWDCRPADIKSP